MTNTINLFHATSSQVFLKIEKDRKLSPPKDTGITSNGLGLNPSGEDDGIYLGENKEKVEIYFGAATEETHFDKRMPNIGVLLEINVEKERLIPDYDDWNKKEGSWEESLKEIGQVVHKGELSFNKIKSITFVYEINKGEVLALLPVKTYMDTIKREIPFGKKLSPSEAIYSLNNLDKTIQTIGLEKAVEEKEVEKITSFLQKGAILQKETKLLMLEDKKMKETLISFIKNNKKSVIKPVDVTLE